MNTLLWFLAALGSLGGIPTIYIVGRWMYRRKWPGRENWAVSYKRKGDKKIYAEDDLQRILIKGNKRHWASAYRQQAGDWWAIDLGKGRIISGFEEIDIETDEHIPFEYSLRLYDKGRIKGLEAKHIARDAIRGKGRVRQEFPPTRLQRIEIRISKPNLDDNRNPYEWKIYGFELAEVMFFKRFLRRRI